VGWLLRRGPVHKTRHVRTAEGSKFYRLPIGAPITGADRPNLPHLNRPHDSPSIPGSPGSAGSVASGHDSLSKYLAGGKLTPERQKLHDDIVAHHLAGHSRSANPTATFLGGGPASGKSSVVGSSAGQFGAVIDGDALKADLPEYGQMVKARDPKAAAYVHEESSLLSSEVSHAAQKGSIDYTLDGTGDSDIAKLTAKVEAARKAGFRTRGLYVTVDTNTAIQRSDERGRQTGRVVPHQVIRDTHASVSRVLPAAIKANLFDQLELWDTSTTPPTKVGEKVEGGSWKVLDAGAWQRFLDKGMKVAKAAESVGDGESSVRIMQAIVLGGDFASSGVPDTPDNRTRWDTIAAESKAIADAGAMPFIPSDYVLDPDLGPDDGASTDGPTRPAPDVRVGKPVVVVRGPMTKADPTATQAGFQSADGYQPSTVHEISQSGSTCPKCGKSLSPKAMRRHIATHVSKALVDDTESIMVALYPHPMVANQLALPGGTAPEDIHVTLAFLGTIADQSGARADIEASLRALAADSEPMDGLYNGIGRFVADDRGEGWPLVALPDVPGLSTFREDVVDALVAAGADVANNHGFTPHSTLAYVTPDFESTADYVLDSGIDAIPVRFDAVWLCWGADRVEIPLSGIYRTPEVGGDDSQGPLYKSIVTKADATKQFTLGPLYPATDNPTLDNLDAHGEYVTSNDLQGSVWDYVRKGDRAIRLQHFGGTEIGECVELLCMPGPVTVPLSLPGGQTVTKTFAAGTPFMGVVWNDIGWPLVQKGLIRGYSFGGRAQRLVVELND